MKTEELYKKNTSRLWNSYNYVKKYNNFKYTNKDADTYYMNSRRDGVLKYLDSLKLGNKISILELGYGAGQNASYFIKRCSKFYGIDVSLPLAKFARKKNKGAVKKGKAKFLVGSMDKKILIKSNSIDVIIIVGALQYVINPNYCFKECKRVLKKNKYLIIAQTNTFQINEMIHPRKFFINFSKFLIGEHHQYSHSDTIKSLLLETKLRKYFKKYNLMVGHTTIPDGVPYKTQLDIDSLSIRIPYPNGSRQIRRSLQPILPMNTKLHEGSIVKNKYVQVVSTLIEMLNIYCPQEEEEVEGEHIMHSDVWRFDPISIMTI